MNTKQGFGLIKIIVTIAIIILFISLLGFNLEQDVVANPEVQTNFQYVITWLSSIWDAHLATPVLYLWNDIFIDLIWQPFLEFVVSGQFFDQTQIPGIEQ